MRLFTKYKLNKESKNASWIISGKVIQMLINLLVSVITARYLGPSNFGVINYAGAYVAFFTSLCNLGINSIIVKNFNDHKEEQGEAIGTTLLLRLISSCLSFIVILAIVCVVDRGEPETIIVVALSSLSLIFHIFETLNFWFQSKYLSKRTAMATLFAYILTATYKVVLLILNKSVAWFAVATSLDYIVYALIVFYYYKKEGGPNFSASRKKAKELLGSSYHFILSGVMVAVYGYTDKIMLKHMLSSSSVGYYSTAVSVCNMWVFVLQAIIDSVYPTIINLHKTDRVAFERKNRQLYAIVFYMSMFVSLMICIFGKLAISIFYGKSFLGAVAPLRIIIWYVAFSYLGVARNAWMVCENQQKYLKYMYVSAVVINISLNSILIPVAGTVGAAVASLITQVFTSLILPCLFKGTRHNSKLMLEAIILKDVLKSK